MRDVIRLVTVAAVLGLATGITASVLAHVEGHSIRPWLACVLAVTAAVLAAVLVESWQRVFGAVPASLPRREAPMLTDRKRGGLDVTVRMVERAAVDPYRFEILRDRLLRLTEERLRTTHGVDLRSEPDRARALVGDGLVRLVAEQPVRPPKRAELEDWLGRLESL